MNRWPENPMAPWAAVRLMDLLWVVDRHELFVIVESVAQNSVLMQDRWVTEAVAASRAIPP